MSLITRLFSRSFINPSQGQTMSTEAATTAPAPVLADEASNPPAAPRLRKAVPRSCSAVHPRLASSEPLDAETLERHLLATENRALGGLAARCVVVRRQLLESSGIAELLSRAEDARHEGADPVAFLEQELAQLQAQLLSARQGRKRIESRRKARSERAIRLELAVAELETRLARERVALREQALLLAKPLPGQDGNPLQRLLNAGLTREQAKLVGVYDPEETRLTTRQACLERLAVIEPTLAKIEAFRASGRRGYQHLAGLGLDRLVEGARRVDEGAAP